MSQMWKNPNFSVSQFFRASETHYARLGNHQYFPPNEHMFSYYYEAFVGTGFIFVFKLSLLLCIDNFVIKFSIYWHFCMADVHFNVVKLYTTEGLVFRLGKEAWLITYWHFFNPECKVHYNADLHVTTESFVFSLKKKKRIVETRRNSYNFFISISFTFLISEIRDFWACW